MKAELWFLVVGALLVIMGVTTRYIERLPLTSAMVYFAVGYAMDPAGVSFAGIDPVTHPAVLERVTEVVVLVSLFTAGLKLRAPFRGRGPDRRWVLPVRLATASMLVTVGLVAALGVFALGLPLGAAVLLGGMLAPTDPVLASDVQVEHPDDRDRLRFALTGEAGLNDGTAFPFVMLGLGLLGLHDLGAYGWRWLAVDVLWAGAGGLAIGGALGWLVGRLVLKLRHGRPERAGADDLVALGLIGLAYGVAVALKAYGFLAVFAAGLMLRRAEEEHARRHADDPAPAATPEGVGDPERPEPYMVGNALGAAEQFERIGEAGVLLILGGVVTHRFIEPEWWWFPPVLFLVVRPLAVRLGAPRPARTPGAEQHAGRLQRRLAMWFGIRGIGSLYYLTYAIGHGLPAPLAERLAGLTISVIVASLVVHGVSVTPLMRRYNRFAEARGARRAPAPSAAG